MYSIAEIVKYFQAGKRKGFCLDAAFTKQQVPLVSGLSGGSPSVKRGLKGSIAFLFSSVVAEMSTTLSFQFVRNNRMSIA